MRPFSEGELAALITLLGDEDPGIAGVAREALMKAGDGARSYLEEAIVSPDARLRGRARLLLEEVRVERLADRLARYSALRDEEMDLLEGALLLAEYAYPDLDRNLVATSIEQASARVRLSLPPSFSDAEGLASLRHVLFGTMGFRGGTFDDPDESYLNRVLERRTGLPISLAMVFTLVGQRAGLPVSGVNLPGFFIARYDFENGPVFLDCWNGGRRLTRDDCERIATRFQAPFADVQLRPEVPRYILARVCANLVGVYRRNNQPTDADHLLRFRQILLGEV